MKSIKKLKGLMVALLIVSLIVITACSGNQANNEPAPTSAPANNTAKEVEATADPAPTPNPPITMKVLMKDNAADFENTEVYKEIVKQTGVTMKIEKFDEKKFQVEMAGGDLPDIIQVPSKFIKELVEGNNIIPLDDLVQTNGPAILSKHYEKSVEYSKQFWSNNTGKLYVIPVQVGEGGFGFEQKVGFNVRWDYYKELGYPKISSTDDMINVLADMVKNHPTSPDGKKVYGVSLWNDWGTWGLTNTIGLMTGHRSNGFDSNTQKFYDMYTDTENSAIWDTADFLFKAKQKGILDPDAFIDKYGDVEAKAAKGTLLFAPATWPFESSNGEVLKQGPDKGFVTIPLDWGYTDVAGKTVAGWDGRQYAISKNAKDPQRAMDLINFLVSEEGSRLIGSGIQGVHWDIVDGKPQMKPETIKLASEGGDPWKLTGIGRANQQGLTDYTVLSDGGIVNLLNTPEVFATKLNSLNEDYIKHYGVTYPAEAYKKYVDEGKVTTLSDVPQDLFNALPKADDEIKNIGAKMTDLITKGIPSIVLSSKDEADYKVRQQALIDELKAAGSDRYFEWRVKGYEDTKAKYPNLY